MLATMFMLLAQTAGEASHGTDWSAIAAKALNIAIFAGILGFILRKPLASFFDARAAAIKHDLERAQREKAEAESRLAEVSARLARLDQESATIRAEAEREAEAEHARITARTDEEVRKIAENTEREIAGAMKSARSELQRFVAEQSVALAERTIKLEMNDADRQRMVGQYAEQLQGVRK